LLIAVAWGTSVGGSGTPMGGAPNLLTIQFLEQQLIGHEFLFTTWLRNVLPLTIVIAVASLIFMRFAFKPEMERVDGSRAYFAQELRALAGMSVPERWGLALFATATMLAFTRQLYAPALPGLTPPFAFLAFAVLSFAIRHNGVPLLEWEFAQTHMVWGLIYLFAGGSALGQILSETGTARFLADRLVPLAGGGGFLAVVVFASYGLALPSASAGPAIAAGYGVSVKTMFSWGVWLAGLITVLLIGAGYLLGRFWPGFGVA
jgi:sodium-dependent dicarboxylate transporter 2/3/5